MIQQIRYYQNWSVIISKTVIIMFSSQFCLLMKNILMDEYIPLGYVFRISKFFIIISLSFFRILLIANKPQKYLRTFDVFCVDFLRYASKEFELPECISSLYHISKFERHSENLYSSISEFNSSLPLINV